MYMHTCYTRCIASVESEREVGSSLIQNVDSGVVLEYSVFHKIGQNYELSSSNLMLQITLMLS